MTAGESAVWSEASLNDVAQPDAPIGYGIVQPGSYVRNGIPVVAIRDLPKPSIKKVHRSSKSIEAAYKRSRIAEGDILISVKGTTGRIGIVVDGFLGNLSRDVARLRLRPEHEPSYWFQMLQSPEAQQILQQAAVGSTRQELSIGTLKQLRFRFPSRQEQERVAAVFSDVDDLVAALERVLVKKQALMQGMRQELLTAQIRLPGFARPWQKTSVGEIATIVKGQQLSRVDMNAQERVPVWNGGVTPSGYTVAPNVSEPVVTVSEGGNSCGWVGRPSGPFWLGGHCYALEPRGARCSVSFLYQVLKFHELRIMALRVGSGLPNIQTTRLAGFELDVPSDRSEADAIAAALDDVTGDVDVLSRRLAKTRALKQAMMQELLNGPTGSSGEIAA